MPTGSTSNIKITTNAIKQTLNALISPSNLQNDLLYSTLVQQRIEHPDYRNFGRYEARLHALLTLIKEMITVALDEQRRSLHIIANQEVTRAEALANIEIDARSESTTLISWSLLYYRYAMAQFNISLVEFAQYVGIHKRTAQRHQLDAIEALYLRFADAELSAQRHSRASRILAKLPDQTPLIGRDDVLDRGKEVFSRNKNTFLSIVGPTGIGKTALACQLVKELVNLYLFDVSIWVESPQKAEDIYRAIHFQAGAGETGHLIVTNPQLDIIQYSQRYNVLVILDNTYFNDREILKVKRLLANCSVVLTSISTDQITSEGFTIRLSDLKRDDSLTYASKLIYQQGISQFEVHDKAISAVENAGGNPAAIQHAIAVMLTPSLESTNSPYTLLEQLASHYKSTFDTLVLISILGQSGIYQGDLEEIRQLIPDLGGLKSVGLLRRYFLLEYNPVKNAYRVRDSIIRQLVNSIPSKNISAKVKQATNLVIANLKFFPYSLQEKVATALLDTTWRHHVDAQIIITKYHVLARRSSQTDIWREQIEQYIKLVDNVPPSILVTYSFCLHHQLSFEKAQKACEIAISLSGEQGDFTSLAWALAEMGAICLSKGAYSQAENTLSRALEYATQYQSPALMDYVSKLYARFCIDQGQHKKALDILAMLTNHFDAGLLQAEIQLATDDLDAAANTLEMTANILQISTHGIASDISRARLNVHYGQLYYVQGRYDDAIEAYRSAAAQYERSERFLQQARCLTNAASAMLHLSQIDEASRLLQQSRHIQTCFGDLVGLQATQMNLTLIEEVALSNDALALDVDAIDE